MSDSEAPSDHRHGHVRGIVERISEHHARAVRQREEEDLAEAVDEATFDLAADIGHPTVPHTAVGYDVEADIGIRNEPPEPRS
jgi:hypothetical protein